MDTTDHIGTRIKQTLVDYKIFLYNDMPGLVEAITDYQCSLAAAMRKGEKIKTKLAEIGSRTEIEWGRNYSQLALLQSTLNESHSIWINAMRDWFTLPIKGLLQKAQYDFKFKSRLVQSALYYFNREQEKSRNSVQRLISKGNLVSSQPYYDDMMAKEELFSAKKQEILQEIEFLQRDKAHEIASMWAKVSDRQPHITDRNLILSHLRPRPRPPPPSDWPSYSKGASTLSNLLRSDATKNRKSLAATFYRGLKHLFYSQSKTDENETLSTGLKHSAETNEEPANPPPHVASPHNNSIVTADTSTSSISPPPNHKSLIPARRDITKIPKLVLSPPSFPPLPPKQYSSTSSSSMIDSPVYSTTPMTLSDSPISFCTSPVSSSPSFSSLELQHLSPISLQDISQSSNDRSTGTTSMGSLIETNVIAAVSALRAQNSSLALHYKQSSESPHSSSSHAPLSSTPNDSMKSREGNNTNNTSFESVVTISPDSVITINDESITSDDVVSFETDEGNDDDEGYSGSNDDSQDEGWRRAGGKRSRKMEEWVPKAEKDGRVVYVRRTLK